MQMNKLKGVLEMIIGLALVVFFLPNLLFLDSGVRLIDLSFGTLLMFAPVGGIIIGFMLLATGVQQFNLKPAERLAISKKQRIFFAVLTLIVIAIYLFALFLLAEFN